MGYHGKNDAILFSGNGGRQIFIWVSDGGRDRSAGNDDSNPILPDGDQFSQRGREYAGNLDSCRGGAECHGAADACHILARCGKDTDIFNVCYDRNYDGSADSFFPHGA